jgi:HEAT repeat protein
VTTPTESSSSCIFMIGGEQMPKTATAKDGVRPYFLFALFGTCLAVVAFMMYLKPSRGSAPDHRGKPESISTAKGENGGPEGKSIAKNRSRSGTGKSGIYSDEAGRLAAVAARGGNSEETESAIREIAALGNRILPDLERLLSSSADTNVREAAAKALAEIGSSESVGLLMRAALEEPNEEQRRILVSALHLLNNPQTAPELTRALIATYDPIVAPTVRDTLARIADGTGTREIARAYREEATEGWQQSSLMGAMLRVRSAETIPVLGDILANDKAFSLRSPAAVALGAIGNQEAIETLLRVFNQPQSAAVRHAVFDALGAVNNKESVQTLVALLNTNTNEAVRFAAAMALGNIPSQIGSESLVSALAREPAEAVRARIQKSLQQQVSVR